MSKNIAISDEVYERLKREKGDRSFSEVIEDCLDVENRIADMTGQGILDGATHDAVKRNVERLSEGTLERSDDDTP